MATYLDAKTAFLAVLNRRDITPTQTDTFMQQGIQRTQRRLRIPSMEKLVQYTVDSTWVNGVAVPGDLLELISIDNGAQNPIPNKMRRVDLKTAMWASQIPGVPEVFCRQGGSFIIGPSPLTLSSTIPNVINVNYYASFSKLAADTDENWLTDAAQDVLVYGALTYASDYFLDERADKFEARYGSIIDDLNGMAQADELSDAAVRPAVNTEDHYGDLY